MPPITLLERPQTRFEPGAYAFDVVDPITNVGAGERLRVTATIASWEIDRQPQKDLALRVFVNVDPQGEDWQLLNGGTWHSDEHWRDQDTGSAQFSLVGSLAPYEGKLVRVEMSVAQRLDTGLKITREFEEL